MIKKLYYYYYYIIHSGNDICVWFILVAVKFHICQYLPGWCRFVCPQLYIYSPTCCLLDPFVCVCLSVYLCVIISAPHFPLHTGGGVHLIYCKV